MAGFIDGIDRDQVTLLPDRLEDWIGEDHLVRVVDLFAEELDLPALGFERCVPARTGRGLPSGCAAEALHLRLSEPHLVQPSPGA